MAEEEAKEAPPKAKEAAPAESASGGGTGLITILGVLNTVATFGLIGALAYLHMQELASAKKEREEILSKQKEQEELRKKERQIEGVFVQLEKFKFNMLGEDPGRSRMITVKLSLEVNDSSAESEINKKIPVVRNLIIDVLSSVSVGELAYVRRREALKDSIRKSLNGFLASGEVKQVYFSNFSIGK